jgi:hypothetical protein
MPMVADGERRKGGRCYSNPACVWVAQTEEQVVVADSQAGGNALIFAADEWAEFIGGVKAGEFDWPVDERV